MGTARIVDELQNWKQEHTMNLEDNNKKVQRRGDTIQSQERALVRREDIVEPYRRSSERTQEADETLSFHPERQIDVPQYFRSMSALLENVSSQLLSSAVGDRPRCEVLTAESVPNETAVVEEGSADDG